MNVLRLVACLFVFTVAVESKTFNLSYTNDGLGDANPNRVRSGSSSDTLKYTPDDINRTLKTGQNRRNSMKIQINTSSCSKSGSNAKFDFWFYDGFMGGQPGKEKIHFERNTELLGPFHVDGGRGESLEKAKYDTQRIDSAGGRYPDVKNSMRLLIIKKTYNGFFSSWTDGWKPESIRVTWSNGIRSYDKLFKFPLDCRKGWITSNDYYTANANGLLYHIGGTESLDIQDIVNHNIPGDIYSA
ncbi:hypothetical protein QR680_014436 [Steinernema hermaphroditum]|uniref:GH16 domain-containing protein n=1 Tax=Steinernema hermaphroditum TaxID=289476 RepID=A0AA39I8V8_9BILA|nr:hypothetical protein QR680_014436 [Steinernema hermaphroditum]